MVITPFANAKDIATSSIDEKIHFLLMHIEIASSSPFPMRRFVLKNVLYVSCSSLSGFITLKFLKISRGKV